MIPTSNLTIITLVGAHISTRAANLSTHPSQRHGRVARLSQAGTFCPRTPAYSGVFTVKKPSASAYPGKLVSMVYAVRCIIIIVRTITTTSHASLGVPNHDDTSYSGSITEPRAFQ